MAPTPQLQAFDYYFQLAAEHHQTRYEAGYDVGEEPGTVMVSRLELELLAARRYGRALELLHAEALAEDDARQHFQTRFNAFLPPDFVIKVRPPGQ